MDAPQSAGHEPTYTVRYAEDYWRHCLDQAAKYPKFHPVRVLTTGRTREDAAEVVRRIGPRAEMVPDTE